MASPSWEDNKPQRSTEGALTGRLPARTAHRSWTRGAHSIPPRVMRLRRRVVRRLRHMRYRQIGDGLSNGLTPVSGFRRQSCRRLRPGIGVMAVPSGRRNGTLARWHNARGAAANAVALTRSASTGSGRCGIRRVRLTCYSHGGMPASMASPNPSSTSQDGERSKPTSQGERAFATSGVGGKRRGGETHAVGRVRWLLSTREAHRRLEGRGANGQTVRTVASFFVHPITRACAAIQDRQKFACGTFTWLASTTMQAELIAHSLSDEAGWCGLYASALAWACSARTNYRGRHNRGYSVTIPRTSCMCYWRSMATVTGTSALRVNPHGIDFEDIQL